MFLKVVILKELNGYTFPKKGPRSILMYVTQISNAPTFSALGTLFIYKMVDNTVKFLPRNFNPHWVLKTISLIKIGLTTPNVIQS